MSEKSFKSKEHLKYKFNQNSAKINSSIYFDDTFYDDTKQSMKKIDQPNKQDFSNLSQNLKQITCK